MKHDSFNFKPFSTSSLQLTKIYPHFHKKKKFDETLYIWL